MLELWLQPVDQVSTQWAEANSFVLDDNEVRRWQRYQSSVSRQQFLVAHVATRHVLSHHGDRAPESWKFDVGTHGRPEIADGPSGLRFNISHTNGMIAVLVHGQSDCGVDIENTTQTIDMRSVARRVFTDAERQSIFSQPLESQADRFYQLWTLKEAVIKAKGKGFAVPLRQFSFAIDGDQIGFECDPAIDTAPNDWQFATYRPYSEYIVSIAAHRQAGDREGTVVMRELMIAGS